MTNALTEQGVRASSRHAVVSVLESLERTKGITILFAAEGGSRAWGFPSDDSDYDVRFVYIEPIDRLLQVRERPDNIETCLTVGLPDRRIVVDCAGWNLRKTLGLVAKSNAALIECLQSPCVYVGDQTWFADELRRLSLSNADDKALLHHYANMAHRCFTEHLKTPTVRLKKYMYAIRPILAGHFIYRRPGPSRLPPVDFETLFDAVKGRLDFSIRMKILQLLKRKRETLSESAKEPVDLELLQWIEDEVRGLRTSATRLVEPREGLVDWAALDKFHYEQQMAKTFEDTHPWA